MKILLRAIAIYLSLSFFLTNAEAASPEMIQKAKQEGSLIWYTSMNIRDSSTLIAAFNKKYPFIQVKRFRLGGGQLLQKILAEHRAGRDIFDVVSTPGFGIHIINKKGLLAQYASPEAKHFFEDARDPKGHWVTLYVNTVGIGFNTALVPPGERPKTWEDLLHPRWKGKIAIDDEEYAWFDMVPQVMGKEKGWRFLEALGNQQINFRDGHTLLAQLTAAGEFPVFLCYVHQVERFKSQGAPIDWARTPFVINILNPIGVSSQSTHPNASRVFIDFALSKGNQEMLVKLGRIVVRKDVETPVPKEVRFVSQDISAADRIEEIRKAFNKTLQLSR